MKLERQSFSITTERLVLTPISLNHKEDIFREFTDDITRLMYPSTPKSIDETISFIEASIEGFLEKREIVVAILSKDTREYLGTAGLHRIDSRTPELGIWIRKASHGNGYGREAIKGLKDWADKHLAYEYLRYPVFVDNLPSKKIPESLGGIAKDEYETTNQKGEHHRAVDYYIYKEER